MKKKLYRLTIYLLDKERKFVLLRRGEVGVNANQYRPLSAAMNTSENPLQTLRRLIRALGEVDFEFMGHQSSMPIVLDHESVRLFPPLHVQVTSADESSEYVDFVYVGRITQPNLPIPEGEGQALGWFNFTNLNHAPDHVKEVVSTVLGLANS